MTKVKPNNENETKSDIFPLDIFKSDTKSDTKSHGTCANLTVFRWTYLNLTPYLTLSKNIKIFQ